MNEIMAGRNSYDPAENLKKKPRKSILKSSSSFEMNDTVCPSGSKRKNGNFAHKETKWDEQNILETLHPPNKDYGHMKIDEPKTPFEKLPEDEVDGAVDPNILAERLTVQKDDHVAVATASGSSDSEEEHLTPEKLAKKKDFESRRKAHYNEFLKAKEALKDLKDEDEEE